MKPSKDTSSKLLRMAHVHETATIHPEAVIARDVEIGPYTTIGKDVEIGRGTNIGPHVILEGKTTIGRNNSIYHGAVLGSCSDASGCRETEAGRLLIGDGNTIRENVIINAGHADRETVVGNGNFIMAYCHISSNCQLGDDLIIGNAVHAGEGVVIEDRAVIAGLSTIKEAVRVGKIAMVGGHSQVDRDVPPYILVDGHQDLRIKVNIIGLRRNGFKPEMRKEIKRVYKIVYRSGRDMTQAVKKIKRVIDNSSSSCEEMRYFLDFLLDSQQGIVTRKARG